MRLPLALVLTIFTALGPVLSVNLDFKPLLRIHRRDGPTASNNVTSTSTTTTSSTPSSSSVSTTTISSSSSTSSSFTPSTTTSPTSSFSSSFASLSSSFSATSSSTSTSSPSASTQESSLSQGSTPTSQSTQTSSPTSSLVTSDSTSTTSSLSSLPRTTFTSTGTDGSLFTVTAVVGTPSSGSGFGTISTGRQGFFSNTGAVAGTFLVVGLVGTGLSICVFLWALRRYRRRKRDQAYFDDEYKEFNQPRERVDTPDATLPDVIRESTFDTPVSSSPTPNMIERLHGNAATVPRVAYDASQYQTQPGEFDPYQTHEGAIAYSDDHPVYEQYPGSNQLGNTAYAYQPDTGVNSHSERYQPPAELSHTP